MIWCSGLLGGGLLVEASDLVLTSVNAGSRVHQTPGLGPSGRALPCPPDVVRHPAMRMAAGVRALLPLLRPAS
ncbi:MAG: hypothetical protein JOZ69_16915 [Myxococcales bacterium]|nr:hypothetical protein [Myxococcales bacterium]